MDKRILFALLLLFSFKISFPRSYSDSTKTKNSKNENPSPYDPKGDLNTFGIKGIFLFAPNGNGAFLINWLGADLGFCKHHSVGIEGCYIHEFGVEDHVTDTAGVYHDADITYRRNTKAVLLDYRYWFNLQKYRDEKDASIYIGCFAKYGTVATDHNQLIETKYISDRETDRSVDIFVGALFKPHDRKHFGFDVNLGCAYKEKSVTSIFRENNIVTTKFEKTYVFRPSLGLNFYWCFFR